VVDSRHDLSASQTRRALREFEDNARDADIAVVYYASHGIEVDGTNYLIPVDAELERDTDVYDEGLSLDRVLLSLEPAQAASAGHSRCLPRQSVCQQHEAHGGLAQHRPRPRQDRADQPEHADRLFRKSRFHGAGRRRQEQPVHDRAGQTLDDTRLDVRKAFGFVRDDVLKSTSDRQEPFVYGSLGGDDVPLVPARAAPSEPAPNPQAEARRDYVLALQVGNKAAFGAFLAQHPGGFYASLAKLQLEKIAAEEARVAATEKAQAAEAERARLAAAGAQRDAQAKAEADAKAAEQARLAAEKAKQVAQDQAAEAERQRTESAADRCRRQACDGGSIG
jgi:hypothetical protein